MAKKAIAAFLLVVIAAWAEMTMAPMFAMHAGHMSPGHEMAADMPASVSGHHHPGHHHTEKAQAAAHQALQVRDQRQQAEHQQAMAEGRPCCPGLRKVDPVATLEVVSGVPACDDPHSCCFRQGPQSMPAPARDIRRLARDLAPVEVIEVSPPRAAATRAIRNFALTLSPPPDVFGMTLRV